MLQITEDTPPDMLAGAMDLTVHLPTGRSVKMSVERSTPMMDLLVQITTNYHLQLSGYTLQALGMAPSKEHSDSILPYKPNTPIGALDTQHIKVIPKARNVSVSKNVPSGHQPFESTFRLKVHLPRNQLYVTRVSQSVHLDDIMKKVCEEKNLDSMKYEFRHPANLDEILDPKLTLSDYAITEIHLVQKGTNNLNRSFSADIMSLRKEEERKQIHSKTGGGVFSLIFRRGKSSTGSLSSDNRSISPTHSDDSRSVTPPGVQQQLITPTSDPSPSDRPKPPQRKRRPAPKPPMDAEKRPEALTICHSRNSSDSSGYHEASVLSDHCNTSLPRRPKSTAITEETQQTISNQHSQSTSNLSKMSTHSRSTSSLAFPSRKKKTAPPPPQPPPPPPVLEPENTETNLEEPSPVVASQPCTVAQTESVASTTNIQRSTLDRESSVQHSVPSSSTDQKPKEAEKGPEIVEIAEIAGIETKNVEEKDNELETDWQYQLPSPPKAFRDSSPVTFTEVDRSMADSVVTSPELFEKLKVVKDHSEKETVSDITSMVSEEEKPILNKLSLENLEKRKSLVYNRELATSLKMQDDERKNETFSSSLVNFEKTYDEVKKSSPKQSVSTSTLPNFKITTYNPKQKLDIFEDDTIRSNTDRGSKRNSLVEPIIPLHNSYNIGRSMENISFRKNSLSKTSDDEFNNNSEYKFYKPSTPKTQVNVFRSESFTKKQSWVPSKPVTRSKSQIALNNYKETKNLPQSGEEHFSKSNSLFDVSGLQSPGVMRLIQTKLNTPDNSVEHLNKEKASYQKQPEINSEVQNHVDEKPVIKTYKYRPPSINMSTWSERPKIPVNVKEDPDYKYSVKDPNTCKLSVNTVNEDMKSHNSIQVKNKTTPTHFTNAVNVRVGHDTNNKNVNIKVNGFEPVNQNSGNVIIKIGGANSSSNKPIFRKPLGNINNENQRPHSIAFGSDFDISRVPIVRSVEFKKPYKEYQTTTSVNGNNTTVTQIFPTDNFGSTKRGSIDQSESPKNRDNPMKPQLEPKPVFRVNSYLQSTSGPVVRGFRSNNEVNRLSWNQPYSFSTLPAKPVSKNFALNAPIPFSQSNLRKAESTNSSEIKNVPPPAPVMPKTFHVGANRDNCGDPKEQLLQAIRDFGGKKGLRAVKA